MGWQIEERAIGAHEDDGNGGGFEASQGAKAQGETAEGDAQGEEGMSEMIERIARAMADRDAMGATPDGPGIHRSAWRAYVPMAQVAIEAMREPTQAMIDAGQPGFSPEMKWGCMIDAALKPTADSAPSATPAITEPVDLRSD